MRLAHGHERVALVLHFCQLRLTLPTREEKQRRVILVPVGLVGDDTRVAEAQNLFQQVEEIILTGIWGKQRRVYKI